MVRFTVLPILLTWACTSATPQEVPDGSDAPEPTTTPAPTPTPAPTGPNILIVLLDDVGVDHVSAYDLDPTAPHTPHLDALAQQGLLFDRAYAHPSCSPTRAAILTGHNPDRTGIGSPISMGSGESVDPTGPTLPRQLGPTWSRAAIGKWHLADPAQTQHPNAFGFDHYTGVLHNLGRPLPSGEEESYTRWLQTTNGVSEEATGYLTTRQTDDAIASITTLPEPWFTYLAWSSAHTPFHAPPPPLALDPELDDNAPRPALFDGMVRAMDAELGRLLDAVDLDDTVVIVLGDNGTASYAFPPTDIRYWTSKFSVTETGVRVPLIVAGPQIAPGRTDALVHAVDLYATTLELAGVEAPSTDSISLLPVLQGDEGSRTHVFSQRFSPNGDGPYTRAAHMIRDDRFKLVHNEEGERFFDMADRETEGPDLLLAETLEPDAAEALVRLRGLLE